MVDAARQTNQEDLTPVDQYMYLPKHARIDPALLVPLLAEMAELHEALTLRNSLRLNVLTGELLDGAGTISGSLNSGSFRSRSGSRSI